MKLVRSIRERLRSSRSDESGFTLVEMVIAIPLTTLILGLVFLSIGVAVNLQKDVTLQSGSSRVANTLSDKLDGSRNCTDLRVAVRDALAEVDPKFVATVGGYTCNYGKVNKLSITVQAAGDTRVYERRDLFVMVL